MGRAVRPLPALAAAGVLALVVARVPEALAGVDAFRVKEIRLEGHRFLTHEEAVRALSVSSGSSLWDDLEPLEERLRGHPLVRDARIRRRLPSTLILEVEERAPVALVPTPDLVPVDASGGTLPLDPAVHRLDLPLVHPFRERGRPDSRLAPDELRSLARE
ncbi:MAG TPA: FtsQ-type POTRA domain-containing protein, partial [Longimicrobiales bacterium]|nr:FtsQ-type POTRA domain-containing protein [Longimicrobiales bacterium]